MKKFFTISIVALTITANAQLLNFGVIGGVNFPNLKLDGNSQISDINTENGTGYHIGAMLRINVPLLYVQPELLYTNTSSDYSFKSGGTLTSGTYNMQRIDIPVMVGFKIGPVALFAGPIASFNISSPDDIFNDSYKAGTFGYQIGAGVKIWRLLGEIKYEGAFSDFTTDATVGGVTLPLDSRTNMLIVSVGYFFGKD